MPIPIMLSVEFLSMNRSDSNASSLQQTLLEVLDQLANVDCSQQGYLGLSDPNHVSPVA